MPKKPKKYLKKPKKSKRDSGISTYSYEGSILPDIPFVNSSSKDANTQSPIKFLKPQISISDEEEQLLLTPLKKDLMQEDQNLQNYQNTRKEKLSAYFLMFCNICRSFIAIGVLAIPFGLTKSGKWWYSMLSQTISINWISNYM